jgi:PKD repeat protein
MMKHFKYIIIIFLLFTYVKSFAIERGSNHFETICDYDSAAFYDVGDYPNSVCSADLDGDNYNDLAVANADSYDMSVLINNGDGTFANAVNYPAGIRTHSICSADFDGDDDIDLATSNYGTSGNNNGSVSVFLNNGDGTFQPAVEYPTHYGYFICTDDLDGDDDYDLAVISVQSYSVYIFLNNGDGTFADAVTYTTSAGISSVTAADFDGDNDSDLAVTHSIVDDISILFNNGDGTFGNIAVYDAGDYPLSICPRDYDGDNDIDLAVSNNYDNDISIFLNDGLGTFQASGDFPTDGTGTAIIYSEDFDGDNDYDLASANIYTRDVRVMYNNGDATFGTADSYGTANGCWSVFSADFDGDNDYDLVTANRYADNIAVLINPETGPPDPVVADFEATPLTGCASLNVDFTDLSTGDLETWLWDFGDNSTSALQNPSHSYDSAGSYSVSLTVSGPHGSDTEIKVDYISVFDAPLAGFIVDIDSGSVPLTVTFTDQSTNDPENWLWNFGDDSTSALQNPIHTYNEAGIYEVTLTASNVCGGDIATDTIIVTIEQTCDYAVGDINSSGLLNGLDVTYAVVYFKGGPPPPYECECTSGNIWYVAGDVNGNCDFNGLDVTYLVNYFKGGAVPSPCPDCPPANIVLNLDYFRQNTDTEK